MPKYYKKHYYSRGSRDKYSVEHKSISINTTAGTGNGAVEIVPATTVEGMRKVKHLTISMAKGLPPSAAPDLSVLYWALVYVPIGTVPNALVVPGSLYEPQSFVMGSGVFDFDAGPLRIRCPLSRNLNRGDRIYLVIRTGDTTASQTFYGMVEYAVTLQ